MPVSRWYYPTKCTFWTPNIAAIERHVDISSTSPLVWALRLTRLAWLIATIPIHVALVLVHFYYPKLDLPLSLTGKDRPSWTLQQRIFYPLVGRFVWAIAGTGGSPGDFTPKGERAIPLSSVLTQWVSVKWGAEKLRVWVEDVEPWTGEEAGSWFRSEVVDPRGEVNPVKVPCFWWEPHRHGGGARKAREGEKIVLYLVGGGYISGSPVEGTRCYDISRESGLRVVAANYRKATSDGRGYPASLQDALTAYMHLVIHLGYENIILAGDSAGAGLANTLLFYLCITLATSPNPPPNLILPTGLMLYSPWCDLTLSTVLPPRPKYADDFLNMTMIFYASNMYTVNLLRRPTDSKTLGMGDAFEGSPWDLGRAHPFFSPALDKARPLIELVNKVYEARNLSLKFLVISGGAELFAPEIRSFVGNLEAAKSKSRSGGGIRVEWFEVEDELHVFMMAPRWVSPNVERMMKKVVEFLGN
ncbi:alpha/beta-hydrolase [Meredithblackwellia eburnea MCA 4105]